MTCAQIIVRHTATAELPLLFLDHLSFGGEAARNASAPLAEKLPETTKSRPCVLVVDDAPDVTEMIGLLLRYAGYEVVTVFSGPEAYEAAQRAMFDVVVSDIGMPGMSGYELAEALRTLPDYGDVPMVAVTGFSMYDNRERALRAGFNAFLTKPISPKDLIDLIGRLRSSGDVPS